MTEENVGADATYANTRIHTQRKTDRQTDRQNTHIHTNTHTHTHTHTHTNEPPVPVGIKHTLGGDLVNRPKAPISVDAVPTRTRVK